MPTASCVFCSIRDQETPASMVLDEANVLAFLDVRPVFPGHVLIVPREHHRNIFELPSSEGARLFAVTQRMAKTVKSAMAADGALIISNNGVSQSVDHLHIHVVPRRKKDGLRGFMWPRLHYGEGEADEVAARIRSVWSKEEDSD